MGHTGLHPRLEASVGVIVTMRHGGLCSIYVDFSSIAADIGTQHVALPWVLVLSMGPDTSETRLLYRHDEVCLYVLCCLTMPICSLRHGALLSSPVSLLLWRGLGCDDLAR